jgi:hypothetical protein
MPRPSAQISPAHPLIREYQRSLAALRGQGVENELGLRRPFENLLADSARLHGWRFVAECGAKAGGHRNREDDAQYILRLVGQVVRVGIETVRIVRSLPPVIPG